MARLFVAIVPPAATRAELAALAGPLAGVRWTPPENLHLTLRFVGEADDGKTSAFERALTGIRVEPFILPVSGVGVFPTRGPARVLWVGLGRAHPRLFQLRKQVDEALLTVDPTLDVHLFHPHFTIGRMDGAGDPKTLSALVARHAPFEAPPFQATNIHLMVSELASGHPPSYRTVRTFSLQPDRRPSPE